MTDLAWIRPKLAELCGYKPSDHKGGMVGSFAQYESPTDGFICVKDWHPDENVEQAVRCLEATETRWEIRKYEVHVTPNDPYMEWRPTTIAIRGEKEPIPSVIVRAIAAAFGWEKPT